MANAGGAEMSYRCLWTPLKTQVNQWIGFLFTYFFMALLYYCECSAALSSSLLSSSAGNVWKAKNFPFMSQALFYENGTVYDQTQILTDNVLCVFSA